MKGRIDYVDGLRAVAILLVLLLHAGTTHLRPGLGLPMNIVDIGTHGADLFYVISGFVLSYPTIVKHFVNTDLRDRLVARLQPAVSAVLRWIRAPRKNLFGNVVPESAPQSQT